MTYKIELTPNTTTDKSNEALILSNAFENEFISFIPMRAAMAEKLSNLIKSHSGDANTRLSKKIKILVSQLSSLATEDDPFQFIKQVNQIYHSTRTH